MILVPTPQLLDLIQGHIDNLSTSSDLDIWLTTPRSALSDSRLDTFLPTVVFIDEPESLLSPLPARHLQGGTLKSHPFHKHPPPLTTLLDRLARSVARSKTETKMVWVGAELNGLLKRIVRQRGWAGMDALELDFEGLAARARKDIESVTRIEIGAEGTNEERLVPGVDRSLVKVEHLAYVVGMTGIKPFTSGVVGRDLPNHRTGRPIIEDSMIEAVVQYQQQYPTPEGTTTLILPLEGYPLDLLATRLTAFASAVKMPMSITTIIPTSQDSHRENDPILLVPRSAVPGLDIPNLSRIILLNGLDLAGLSPAQRSRGGIKKRAAFYDVVSGRLGRLGSVTYKYRYQNSFPGQVVSFVTEDSGEEVGLGSIDMTQRGGFGSHIESSHHQGETQ